MEAHPVNEIALFIGGGDEGMGWGDYWRSIAPVRGLRYLMAMVTAASVATTLSEAVEWFKLLVVPPEAVGFGLFFQIIHGPAYAEIFAFHCCLLGAMRRILDPERQVWLAEPQNAIATQMGAVGVPRGHPIGRDLICCVAHGLQNPRAYHSPMAALVVSRLDVNECDDAI